MTPDRVVLVGLGLWVGAVTLILAFFRAASRHDPEDWQ